MRRWLVGLGLLLVPAVVAGSCALPSFDDAPAPTATTTSSAGGFGGAGGDGGAGGGGGQQCAHRSWPELPDGEGGGGVGGGGVGDVEFWVAVNSIDVGTSDAPVGFDVDHTCTCLGEGASCVPPAGEADACDGPDGVDNQLVGLFAAMELILNQDVAEFYSARAAAGEWSLLLRIRDYNGLANDRQVRLAWYVTHGFTGTPSWDGSDVWPITDSSVLPVPDGDGTIDSPRYEDANAYVADRVLVATLPQDSELVLAGGLSRMALRLTIAVVTGTIELQDGRWTLTNGLIGGRLKDADLFYALSSFRDEYGGAHCTDDVYYILAKPELCGARDILSGDGTASQPCDALSLGVGFGASAALPGIVAPAAVPTPGCPLATDPLNESCES